MSTPFEDKRRTASMDVRRANIYKRIEAVFDQSEQEVTHERRRKTRGR